MENDLKLIAGDFFDLDLPKSKQYLWKYFTTDVQRQFLRYYLTFGTTARFVENTGHFCRPRWLASLVDRLDLLETTLKKAREDLNFEVVAAIESGNYTP
jgi:hypothetical protein